MSLSARLPIAARRFQERVLTVRFRGLDLAGQSLAMPIRRAPDQPGPALIPLAQVNAAAEGVRLTGVSFEGGVPVSIVEVRISAATMGDASKVPYPAQVGRRMVLAYELVVAGTTRLEGAFIVLPSTFGSDASPMGRAPATEIERGDLWEAATLTFGDEVTNVSIDGIDQLQPLVARAEAAIGAASEQADRAGTSAEDASAEADRAEYAASLTVTDGYLFDPVTGTRYRYAAVDGRIELAIAPHIYIDWWNGDDTHDGLTPATAIRTRAGLFAHQLVGGAGTGFSDFRYVDGLTIGIKGHPTGSIQDMYQVGRPSARNGWRLFRRCSWVRYGAHPVRMDCSDRITAAWTPHPTKANAYRTTITHELGLAEAAAECRVKIWRNGKPLTRMFSVATLVPGTFYYVDPIVSGVPLEVTIIDYEGSDPRSNGIAYDAVARPTNITTAGGFMQGIWCYRPGHRDGGNVHYAAAGVARCRQRACLVIEGATHSSLAMTGDFVDNVYVNSPDLDDPFGVVPAQFVIYEDVLDGSTSSLLRCGFIADTSLHGPDVPVGQIRSQGFIVHDAADPGPDLISLTDCWSWNMGGGHSVAPAKAALVRRMSIAGDRPLGLGISSGLCALIVSESAFDGCVHWLTGRKITVRQSLFMSTTLFSGGGITTDNLDGIVDVQDCIFAAAPDQAAPAIEMNAVGTVIVRHNVFLRFGTAVSILSGSAPATNPVLDLDWNVYGPTSEGGLVVTYKAASYSLAAWKTAAPPQGISAVQDLHSAAATTASAAGFASNAPAPTDVNVRLALSGLATQVLRSPITQQTVGAFVARPRTQRQAEAFCLAASSLQSVLG